MYIVFCSCMDGMYVVQIMLIIVNIVTVIQEKNLTHLTIKCYIIYHIRNQHNNIEG